MITEIDRELIKSKQADSTIKGLTTEISINVANLYDYNWNKPFDDIINMKFPYHLLKTLPKTTYPNFLISVLLNFSYFADFLISVIDANIPLYFQ